MHLKHLFVCWLVDIAVSDKTAIVLYITKCAKMT